MSASVHARSPLEYLTIENFLSSPSTYGFEQHPSFLSTQASTVVSAQERMQRPATVSFQIKQTPAMVTCSADDGFTVNPLLSQG